jgi:dTDP-4-dehydrorhamnose reductase
VFRQGDLHVVGTSRRPERGHRDADAWLPFELDGEDPAALLEQAEADIVVHCAALSSRLECEGNPAYAQRVNRDAPARLAATCAERGTPFFFISTDLVFNGSAAPYSEQDPVTPASVYAETKAEAEIAVRKAHAGAYILRTALMYGLQADGMPGSFLTWNLGKPLRGETVELYTNQYRRPLHAPDVPRAILALRAHRAPAGVYHLAGPDRLSRMEIGTVLARHFAFPTDLLLPATLPVVDDTSLSVTRIASACGFSFTGFEEGVTAIASGLSSSRPRV